MPDALWAARQTLADAPVGWNAIPESLVSRQFGAAWRASARSALLLVPSVIIEEEHNVLINPGHADAGSVVACRVRRFLYAARV